MEYFLSSVLNNLLKHGKHRCFSVVSWYKFIHIALCFILSKKRDFLVTKFHGELTKFKMSNNS